MTYDLKKSIGAAAKIGTVGLGAIVFGEVSSAEIAETMQNLGYITLAASVIGASAAGLAGLIDRERPYKKEDSKKFGSSSSKKFPGELSLRQKYLEQRAAQRYNQKLALDERIRKERYEKEAQIAESRMGQGGLSGALWRTFYRVKH